MTSKLTKPRTRGRHCKSDVPRAASGRISRAAGASDVPDRVAKDARMRLFGLSKDDAGQPAAGTVIGRMMLSGDLSTNQYEALRRYSMTRERYMIAMQVPDSFRTSVGGVMAIANDDADIGAKEAWDRLQSVIMQAQQREPGNLIAALNYMVTRDEHHAHMIGDLRIVSNALVRHYRLT